MVDKTLLPKETRIKSRVSLNALKETKYFGGNNEQDNIQKWRDMCCGKLRSDTYIADEHMNHFVVGRH